MLVHAPTDDYSSFYYEWDPVEKRYFLYKKDFKEAKADDVF
jgi:hypothetical protein